MSTLKEYLEKLVKLAFPPEIKGVRQRGDPIVRNFLKHHTCVGVENGSPVWRRLPSFYGRRKPRDPGRYDWSAR